VADICLADGSIFMAHEPSVGLAGLLQPGVKLIVTPIVRKDNSKTKWDTERCTHKIWLVLACDKENEGMTEEVWIGSNPMLGNSLAAAAISRRLLPKLPTFEGEAKAEVPICGGKSRVDFMLPGEIPLEVKSIVCADYREKNLPDHLPKPYIGREVEGIDF